MKIEHNKSLALYNTFGIDVTAKHFVSVTTIDNLKDVLQLAEYPQKFILGGGSNLLLTQDIDALVIHVNLKGKEVLERHENTALVKAYAGENWHDFVLWTLRQDFGGLENLSLIPGNVGTSPVQNIGAYGVELKDLFVSCNVIHTKTLEEKIITNKECQFGYRNSIFKNTYKGDYIITSVTFKLTTTHHELHTSYGAIASQLEAMKITSPTVKDVSKAVIAIRQSKLPNPKDIGNSGSFFKNPIISKTDFAVLQQQFPEIPSYKISDTEVKIPAGWLIEKAGFKGKTFGNYGVHKKQALVLVNYGGATGKDIYALSQLIQKTVERLFGIIIHTEVNII